MGYNTDYKGELLFKKELNREQIVEIKKFFGEDCRKHSEWSDKYNDLLYIDLEFNEDLTGIKYNGNEKSYHMVEHVNLIIENMRKKWPDFGLQGNFLCLGENIDDRWRLIFNETGFAEEAKIIITGKKVKCVHCNKTFTIESEEL